MKIVNAEAIAELLSRAAASPRKRMNLNLHAEQTDSVGRFLNAGIAGTYVRPHRHRIDRWELVTVLKGRFDVLIFTSDGVVKSRVVLGSQGASVAEIPGGEWHSVVFHAPAAVVLEVKAGPYEPQLDKEFASCADIDPAERGRADRIGIPQRKKTGSPTQQWVIRDRVERPAFPIMSAMPPKATTGCQIAIRREWDGPAALPPPMALRVRGGLPG